MEIVTIPRSIWDRPDLSLEAIRLWGELFMRQDKDLGGAAVTIHEMCKMTRVKSRKIFLVMAELSETGLISKTVIDKETRLIKTFVEG